MMKKLLVWALLATAAFGSAQAQTPVKYQGEVDLGYSIGTGTFAANRVNVHTIHGARIGRYFSTGLGLGVDYYHEGDGDNLIVPIFLDFKGYLPVSEKLAPYLSFDLGVGVGASGVVSGFSGLYCTPAVGLRANRFMAQVGYNVQRISENGIGFDMGALQLKVGIVF